MAAIPEKERGTVDRGLGGTVKFVPSAQGGPQGVILHGQKVWELEEDVQIVGTVKKDAARKTAQSNRGLGSGKGDQPPEVSNSTPAQLSPPPLIQADPITPHFDDKKPIKSGPRVPFSDERATKLGAKGKAGRSPVAGRRPQPRNAPDATREYKKLSEEIKAEPTAPAQKDVQHDATSTKLRTRGTENTLARYDERGISDEGFALEEFTRLLKAGPADQRSAPKSITLPQNLYEAIRDAASKSYEDGVEHGGIFGYFDPQRKGTIKLGILYTTGEDFQINYSKTVQSWPALRPLGRFHTHLYQTIERGSQKAGWASGAQSGDDIANFYRRDDHSTIVYAQTKWGKWKFFLLLKPQEYSMPGTPAKIGKEYHERVAASVERGIDPIEATEKELGLLAQKGAFVLYTGEDSPTLARQF
jgi:hypothetical protein